MHWMHNTIHVVDRTNNYVGRTISNIKMHSYRTMYEIESQIQFKIQILTQIKSFTHF